MRSSLAHFLTIVGLLCASSAEAATYYVRTGGNDSADGRSHATAWASLNKVNGYSFAAGDRVLFHEGDRWVGQLTVDWAGTASQRAVVGAYYLDGSTRCGATVPLGRSSTARTAYRQDGTIRS